uniref:Ion transport domain-containing protein n=1 Tax=Plectus sambesii TaxID=2011161 RepID=A0A914V3A6_9BILA
MSRRAVRSSIPLIHEATSDENLPESLKPRQSADGELLTYRDRNHVARSLFSCCSKSSRDSADEGFVYISVVRQRPCRPTLLFDPAGQLCYYWSGVVSVAFLYNLWVISYRIGFDEIRADTKYTWFALDYSADFIYILDLLMGFRTCYFTDGVLQTNAIKIRQNYMNSLHFYLGCLSLLPLDVLYLSFGYLSVVRCIRLVKIYKFWAFIDISERHTSYPNSFRVLVLIHYLLLVFHWNACILYSYRD